MKIKNTLISRINAGSIYFYGTLMRIFWSRRNVSESTLVGFKLFKVPPVVSRTVYRGKHHGCIRDERRWYVGLTAGGDGDPVHTTFRISLPPLVFAKRQELREETSCRSLFFFALSFIRRANAEVTLKRRASCPRIVLGMYRERLVHFCNCGVHGRESVLLA